VKNVTKYRVFKLRLQIADEHAATFTLGGNTQSVKGFRTGDGEYVVRFMPNETGVWQYSVGKSEQ